MIPRIMETSLLRVNSLTRVQFSYQYNVTAELSIRTCIYISLIYPCLIRYIHIQCQIFNPIRFVLLCLPNICYMHNIQTLNIHWVHQSTKIWTLFVFIQKLPQMPLCRLFLINHSLSTVLVNLKLCYVKFSSLRFWQWIVRLKRN